MAESFHENMASVGQGQGQDRRNATIQNFASQQVQSKYKKGREKSVVHFTTPNENLLSAQPKGGGTEMSRLSTLGLSFLCLEHA